MSKSEISLEVRQYMAELSKKGASKGGKARAKKLTPAQRSESARKAVKARWAKIKREKKHGKK